RRFHGVGSGKLITGENRCRLSIESPLEIVSLRAEIDARDVFHPPERPVRICPNNYLAKFLRRFQSALRANRVSEFLSARNRLPADLACPIYRVLLLYFGGHVRKWCAQIS